MALQKPIVDVIAAFDANASHDVEFIVNGGDQVVANRAVIKLGSTNEVVYDATETTFNLVHTIPAGTLTNGNYYVINIYTLDSDSAMSSPSSPVTFYCYTTPTFGFSNLPQNHVISNSSFTFDLSYNQSEGEALDAYIINVYDSSQTKIWSSDTVYVGANGVPPAIFSATVAGFSDSAMYYIRAMGQTTQLTELDTGYVLLSTIFDADSIYTQFELTNNECEGYIMLTSNLISLEGVSNPDPPTYINNEEIDLTSEDSYVTWENSFAIYDKSTVRIWLRDINPDTIIATFYNTNDINETVVLTEREYEDSGTTYLYIECVYSSANGTSGYIYSAAIEKPSSGDEMMIWLQKDGGMYDISVAEVTS